MLMPTYTVLGADMIVLYFSHHGLMDYPSFAASENLVSKNRVLFLASVFSSLFYHPRLLC